MNRHFAMPPPAAARFIIDLAEDRAELVVTGEVDISNLAQLQHHLDTLVIRAPTTLVIDLRDLEFIDMRGVDRLRGTARTVEALGGSLLLRSPGPAVRRVLQIVGWDPAVVER